jgi:hypothetical protein
MIGIPIFQLNIPMSILPPGLADKINAPLMRWLLGDITKLGLRKLPYGPLEQIQKDGSVQLIDIGTIKHIREGHIEIFNNIDHILQKTIYFVDGKTADFDAIVAGIGYYRDYTKIIEIDKKRFEDLKVSVNKQKYFGDDGLYFCGFWVAPTGQIREIALDAQKIARDIIRKENTASKG